MAAQFARLTLLVFGALFACSQPMGSISGVVLDETTNVPIAGAKVSINRVSQSSDAAGRFQFVSLKPDAYHFSVEREGFAKFDSHSVRHSSGEKASNITLRLTPESVISGHIQNAMGAPVSASVFLSRADSPTHVVSALAKNEGDFRIAALPAGRYKLSAQACTPTSGQTPLTYFPRVLTHREGEVIEIKAGEIQSGIVVSLRELSTTTVTGRFAGKIPKAGRCFVVAENANGESRGVMPTGQIDGERQFTLSVPRGAYRLKVNYLPQGAGLSILGFIDLTIPATNLDNIAIPASPFYSVRARFKGTVTSETSFMLNPTERLGVVQWSKPAGDGTLVATGVSPDRYSVMVGRLPEGTYVQAILAGGADITTSGLDLITGTATDLEILIARNGGTVAGVAPPGASISIERVSDHRTERELFHYRIVPDAAGKFVTSGIAPGEYRIGYRADGKPSNTRTIRVTAGSRLQINLL